MKAKLAAQSVYLWETNPIHYARRMSHLTTVISNMTKLLEQQLLHNKSLNISIPHDEVLLWEGFVTDITSPPKDIIQLCVR